MSTFTASSVTTISNLDGYKVLKNSNDKCVLLFWTSWHEPSDEGGQIDDVFKTLARKYPKLRFFKADAESPDLVEVIEELNVVMVPTVTCIIGGNKIGTVEGTAPSDISKLVKLFNESTIQTQKNETELLNERLKKLINTAPVMLFMKGTQ